MSRSEKVVLGAAFTLVWALVAWRAGGPISSDEVFYLDLSMDPRPEGFVLNRYFHVYFQKLFLALFHPPLLAVRVYWAFLFAASALAVYAAARRLCPSAPTASGALAAALFLGQPTLFRYAGVTYSDFTAMFMVAVGIWIYLEFVAPPGSGAAGHLLFGATVLLAFKSKETGAALAVLVLGVLAPRAEPVPSAIRRLGWLAAGIGVGVLVMIVLDGWWLHDPLFSLRFTSLRTHFAFNFLKNDPWERPRENWIGHAWSSELLAAFALYLATLWRGAESRPRAERVVWMVPLAVLLLVELPMLRAKLPVSPYYLAPAYPALCMAAGPFAGLLAAAANGRRWKPSAALAALGMLAVSLGLLLLATSGPEPWEWSASLRIVIAPVILCVLLAAAAWRDPPVFPVLAAACLLPLVALPVAEVATGLARRDVAHAAERRFFPYSAFASDLQISSATRVFISQALYTQDAMLAKNEVLCRTLFNLSSGAHARIDQFEVADVASPDALRGVLEKGYDYVLLRGEEAGPLESGPAYVARRADFAMGSRKVAVLLLTRVSPQK
jgi:4-amino-4-deoxy-L-arabinose transferase-like glycosyltransferase